VTKAEAKRRACNHAAGVLTAELSSLSAHDEWDEWAPADRDRFERAIEDLVDEMSRRGGEGS